MARAAAHAPVSAATAPAVAANCLVHDAGEPVNLARAADEVRQGRGGDRAVDFFEVGGCGREGGGVDGVEREEGDEEEEGECAGGHCEVGGGTGMAFWLRLWACRLRMCA